MLSTVLELVGFVGFLLCLFFLAGALAAGAAFFFIAMVVGYMIGEP